ncbi:MAG: RNA polymerase sigma factor [Pseudomonadota bacterium]
MIATAAFPGLLNSQAPESGAPKVVHVHRSLDDFLADVELRAFRIARFALKSDDDALDVVQEAMMRLAERYADRPPTEWPPLFHRILQSKIFDWHRRESVRGRWRAWRGENDDRDLIEQAPDRLTPSPTNARVDAEFADALERAVATLPLRQQQTFLLRAWEGLDVKQTAKAMGCTQGSVKTHYSRAVRKLREALHAHAPTS